MCLYTLPAHPSPSCLLHVPPWVNTSYLPACYGQFQKCLNIYLTTSLKSLTFFLHLYPLTSLVIYTKSLSTLWQLLVFVHEIHLDFSKKPQIDVLYLNFREAFNRSCTWYSPGQTLVNGHYWQSIWSWFRTYLSNTSRSQHLTINGVLSESLPVTSGVPQGVSWVLSFLLCLLMTYHL